MRKNSVLFFTFLKIGLFTFGGGYAMIALLKNEFVMKRRWITDEAFYDMTAIAESTPGPVAVNSATYIGYHTAGLWGAFVATAAVCIPSFTIIYGVSSLLENFPEIPYIGYAIGGIQSCVVYLILTAGIQMLRSIRKTFSNLVMAITIFAAMLTCSLLSLDFSSLFYILVCGMTGVAEYYIKFTRRQG